ncbi:hypothetical protein F4802DRAFT_597190 [Xylaria palmicola]|nr:hypothetical protein F4802DRAFT_597190 [Xylaria palmicola]
MHVFKIGRAILFITVAAPSVVHCAIAIGNQKREGSTEFVVAWLEGVNPCTSDTEITVLGAQLCGHNFMIDNSQYFLDGCSTDDHGVQSPSQVLREDDKSVYGTCTKVKAHRINCKGGTHHVDKEYVCG